MSTGFLDACEREALHRSGAGLPHGVIIVADDAGIVRHVSAHVGSLTGEPPEHWLGKPLPAALARLTVRLGPQPGSRVSASSLALGTASGWDVVASRGEGGGLVVECVPADQDEPGHPAARRIPETPETFDGEEELAVSMNRLVESVGRLTGFERVMYYRFMDDGDGEVVAEHCQGAAQGRYAGLRFPASDIPQIARALYLRNPWRLIPDACAAPAPIVGLSPEPPDLTWSDLRSVSPVHQVYLANMGVRASLSLPIRAGNTLAALVACHHGSVRHLPLSILEQASTLARAHSLGLSAYQVRRRMRLIDGLVYRFDEARQILQRHGDIGSAWPELGPWLMREFQCEGAVLAHDGEFETAGMDVPVEALAALEDWSAHERGEAVTLSDRLSRAIPHWPPTALAGALIVRVRTRTSRNLALMLLRTEHAHEVSWGGNPEKPIEYHDGQYGIAPRRSFEKWIEKRLGHSRPWDNEVRLLALRLRDMLAQAL